MSDLNNPKYPKLSKEQIDTILKEAEFYETMSIRYNLMKTVKKILGKTITFEDVLLSMKVRRNHNGELIVE